MPGITFVWVVTIRGRVLCWPWAVTNKRVVTFKSGISIQHLRVMFQYAGCTGNHVMPGYKEMIQQWDGVE